MASITHYIVLLLIFFIYDILPSPVSQPGYAVKDSHAVPPGWKRVGDAPPGHVINLQIALRQSNFDELERHLFEVSDPDHSRYGQHLSMIEVNDLIKPQGDTFDQVYEWLLRSGIGAEQLTYSQGKDWIFVSLQVSDVERLLDTAYAVYENEDGTKLVRTSSWSLPAHLHDHIETIQPTNSFFRMSPRRTHFKIAPSSQATWEPPSLRLANSSSIPPVALVCSNRLVTPTCLRVLYGTYDYVTQASENNQIGMTNYLGESSNRSDVRLFLQKYRPNAADGAEAFATVSINGGIDVQAPRSDEELQEARGIEGDLDAETIIGISYPTPMTVYITGGSPPFKPSINSPSNTNEPYLEWVQSVLHQPDVPQVISTSYGDDEQTVPKAYARVVCRMFAQLGARGISLLFASGDSGVGPTGSCITNDAKNKTQFLPLFPASCPYVTTVGATKNFNPEVAAYDPSNDFASGGGFSNYFARPHFQNRAVESYLETIGDLHDGLYNPGGRAYPDIAAQGQSYVVVWAGQLITVDGTSASTPAAAAVLSLVNDALIADGRRPLGYLNPWLYKRGYKGFNDITNGSSVGCGGNGFPTGAGWDPVTGFGTPRFGKLVDEAFC